MHIREATEADVPQLCAIAKVFIEESDYGWVYSPEVSAHTWRRYVDSPSVAVLIAEREDDTICGGGVVTYDRDFTSNRVGYVIKFYILPEWRRTRAPLMVAKAMADWFDENQCWASFATVTAQIGRDEAYEKLMARFGYAPTGPTLMRLPYAAEQTKPGAESPAASA